jgi:hypothetical protein
MKIEKLAAVAEIVSSVAIVVTLGYLAIQTRQNTLATQATIRQSILSEDRELLLRQMEYPHVSPAMYGVHEYSDQELVELSAWLIAFLKMRESHWLQYQNGAIDGTTWNTHVSPVPSVLASELSRSLWAKFSTNGTFDPEFVRIVNEYVAAHPYAAPSTLREGLGFE